MNKNKIIFAILWWVAVFALLLGVMYLNSTTTQKKTTKLVNGTISLWMVGDNKDTFQQIITDFKNQNKDFAAANVTVESFASQEEYNLALSSAFVKGKAPDIFVLNSNEETSFEDQISWLPPSVIDPQNFRKNFKEFFGDKLIKTAPWASTDKSTAPVEFVEWVPVWYETLGILFNRRYFESKDMESWSNITQAAMTITSKDPTIIPIAMGNGSVTPFASDIISQFFMLGGFSSLDQVEGTKMKEALATYLSYGDTNGSNKFNARFTELVNSGKNGLDMFARENAAAIVWYPRMLNDLSKLWFKKSFLLVSPFPHYSLTDGKTLVNYNIFVINKNTLNYAFAEKFLTYLASESWAKKFLSVYPYYLPAQVGLEADMLSQKVNADFNVTLKDFYSDTTLGTFDKGIGYLYDSEMIKILDDSINALSRFDGVKKLLVCKTKKIISLSSLSTDCDTGN